MNSAAVTPAASAAAHAKAARAFLPNVEEDLKQLFGEVFEDADEAYRVRSPIHVVDQIKCPVLLMGGEMDHVVPPYHARALHTALEGSGTTSRCVVLPWLGHFFEAFGFHGNQFDRVLDETLGWLTTHLAALAPSEASSESRAAPSKSGPATALGESTLMTPPTPKSANGSPATDTMPSQAPADAGAKSA